MGDPAPVPSISIVLVRPLAEALATIEGAPEAFFRATDLTPRMLEDREAHVSPAQFCVAWAEALRLSGDPTLALTLASAMPPGAFGVVEYVCRSTPTLGDGLREWVRYLGILDDAVAVGLTGSDGHTALRVIEESDAPAPASHELCFAIVAERARAMVGDAFEIAAVHFEHRVPNIEPYTRFFDAPVELDAPYTEMLFESALMDAPLNTADAHLLSILQPNADALLERASDVLPLTDQVRRALRSGFSQGSDQLDAVATHLGLTGRSLQRRLKDEGTSFQGIHDETRQKLADRYLAEDLSLAEISFLLGFSAPSAFFRAFKRWTGMTPLERRAAQRV